VQLEQVVLQVLQVQKGQLEEPVQQAAQVLQARPDLLALKVKLVPKVVQAQQDQKELPVQVVQQVQQDKKVQLEQADRQGQAGLKGQQVVQAQPDLPELKGKKEK
jgi:hypothetical protein